MAEQSEITWTDSTALAYLGGVVDSDGFISIHRSSRKGVLYHAPVVGISGTRREPLDLAARLWGGNIWPLAVRKAYHRNVFQWARQGRAAATAIAAIAPYLLIKADNATLALELWQNLEDGRSSDPFPWHSPGYSPVSDREAMRLRMVQVLNQGRRPLVHNGFPVQL